MGKAGIRLKDDELELLVRFMNSSGRKQQWFAKQTRRKPGTFSTYMVGRHGFPKEVLGTLWGLFNEDDRLSFLMASYGVEPMKMDESVWLVFPEPEDPNQVRFRYEVALTALRYCYSAGGDPSLFDPINRGLGAAYHRADRQGRIAIVEGLERLIGKYADRVSIQPNQDS